MNRKIDRMGLYIRMVCQKEGIHLRQLSEGLCDVFFKLDYRQRAGSKKLLMDTLIERLGKWKAGAYYLFTRKKISILFDNTENRSYSKRMALFCFLYPFRIYKNYVNHKKALVKLHFS